MPTETSVLNAAIADAAARLGTRSGPAVTDAIIGAVYPESLKACRAEGSESHLRNGLKQHVQRVLRTATSGRAQRDFADVEKTYAPYFAELKSDGYFVPSRGEYVLLAELASDAGILREAVEHLSAHIRHCVDDRNALQRLLDAVAGNASTPANDDHAAEKAA